MNKMGTIDADFSPISAKSNYFKATPGEHRLRVLGQSISGWLYWLDTPDGGRKPVRLTLDQNPPVSEAETVKKFLAFPVWNYELEKVQIWEVTQSTIQQRLKSLDQDKEWGALTGYDLGLERTGTDKNNTKYQVTPKPKSELSKEAKKAVEEGLPVLSALYKNEDPFSFNPNATEDVDADEIKD